MLSRKTLVQHDLTTRTVPTCHATPNFTQRVDSRARRGFKVKGLWAFLYSIYSTQFGFQCKKNPLKNNYCECAHRHKNIRKKSTFEKSPMNSEIFLKSWNVLWAVFQCRLFQFSEAIWGSLKLSEALKDLGFCSFSNLQCRCEAIYCFRGIALYL